MYQQHFGLTEYPFGLTPDTSYFYPSLGAQAAINTVTLALENGEGLIKVVGEVGTGKTMVCRHVLNQLDPASWATAFIPNPNLSPAALHYALLLELGRKYRRSQDYGLINALENRLLELAQEGRRAVAFIDETQAMPTETLEALRLITNLETEKRKLLQIVLFGQPELDTKLADPAVRQIRSRIVFHENISPMTASETPVYVTYRVTRAGSARPLFSHASLDKLHQLSGGIPRYINVIAHKSLLLAFGEGRHDVTTRHVLLAGKDTPGSQMAWLDRVRVWRAA